ncbi:hypothetical protein [Haloarcula marina]|uniref:hypothetical protein n=1 Tax=Haloarcula marina TaxID=2961574 RepID=UPI0020B71D24|nr:hypothetical protein [Halomicroarcula marina]
MRWQLVAVVGLLLTTAGCTGFADFGNEATPVTPAPVPTERAEARTPALPAGVTDAGLQQTDRLVAAHRQALANRSYTFNELYSQRQAAGTDGERLHRSETTRVTGVSTYRHELVRQTMLVNGSVRRYAQSTYGDGTHWYERQSEDGDVRYTAGTIRFTSDQFAYESAFYVEQYADANWTANGWVRRDGERYYRIRGVGGRPPSGVPAKEYRFDMLVGTDGVVHRFEVAYTVGSRVVRYEFWYTGLDETRVDPPDWLPAAEDATGV